MFQFLVKTTFSCAANEGYVKVGGPGVAKIWVDVLGLGCHLMTFRCS